MGPIFGLIILLRPGGGRVNFETLTQEVGLKFLVTNLVLSPFPLEVKSPGDEVVFRTSLHFSLIFIGLLKIISAICKKIYVKLLSKIVIRK